MKRLWNFMMNQREAPNIYFYVFWFFTFPILMVLMLDWIMWMGQP